MTGLLLALAFAAAQPPAAAGAVAYNPHSPVHAFRAMVYDLATRIAPQDAPFQQYFSLHEYPIESRPVFRQVFRFWLNHLSAARSIVDFVEVPDTSGSVLRIDIRRAPNWTRRAWEIVGNRDPFFREIPLGPLPHREVEFVRQISGLKQDPNTLSVTKIVNAWHFMRDTMEGNRSPSYYDLLYAFERHPDTTPVITKRKVKKTITHKGGPYREYGYNYDNLEAGTYAFDVVEDVTEKGALSGVPQANFPATATEFERRWGGEIKAEELKALLIDPRVGGIGIGMRNDPKAGSFVAINDRVIRVTPTRFGTLTRTYDVFKNAGKKDPIERLRQNAAGDIVFDGSEILASLPNGAQAGFLCGADEKRVEIAPSDLAQIRGKIDTYVDVRTHMSCVICHVPNGGFIPFSEQLRSSIEAGLKGVAKSAEEEQVIRDFYLSWDRQVKQWQQPYLDFVTLTTSTPANPKGMTPAAVVKEFQKIRDVYDEPVTLQIAANSCGTTEKELQAILFSVRSVKARVNQLAVGKPIPRTVWEEDTFREIMLLIDASKPDRDPLRQILTPQFLEDALKKAQEVKP